MGRAPSDINLRYTDAAKPPKRSRKDRKKPAPPDALKAGEADAVAFAESLPLSPGITTEQRGDSWQVQAPHSDHSLWMVQLCQAFGTRSDSLIRVFIVQLKKLCPEDWDFDRQAWKADETEWNALLAMVADHKPENSTQAALAAQMAATHLMVMRLSAQALKRGHTVVLQDAALAGKLSRTFAQQCDTMQALKGKPRTAKQSIHVTKETSQHVHYHDHRGGDENANQSHGRNTGSGGAAGINDPGEAVWSEEPGGQSLPGTSGTGQRALPVSRRKSGGTEG